MSDDQSKTPSPPLNVASLRESLDIEPLLVAARQELPSASLTEQVLLGLAQRRAENAPALSQVSRQNSRRAWFSVSAAAALVAAAASVALLFHPRARSGSTLANAEPAKVAAAASHSVVPAAPPVMDPCLKVVTAAGRQPTIDDFEDGDDAILPFEGRSGLWRWVRDTDRPGTAPALLPIPHQQPRANNRQALHVKGGALLDWGTSIEFTFQPACYDASAYRGVKLRVKGPGRVYLAAREVRLIPSEGGGTCQGNDCYNVHVKKFDVPAQYTTIAAFWFELKQRGYNHPPVDPRQLHSIAVFVRPEDTPYDLWLDDLSFID